MSKNIKNLAETIRQRREEVVEDFLREAMRITMDPKAGEDDNEPWDEAAIKAIEAEVRAAKLSQGAGRKKRRGKKPAAKSSIDPDAEAMDEAKKIYQDLEKQKFRELIHAKNIPEILKKIHENHFVNGLSNEDFRDVMALGGEVQKMLLAFLNEQRSRELFLFAVATDNIEMAVHLLHDLGELPEGLIDPDLAGASEKRRAIIKLLNFYRGGNPITPRADGEDMAYLLEATKFIANFNVTTADEMGRILALQSGAKYDLVIMRFLSFVISKNEAYRNLMREAITGKEGFFMARAMQLRNYAMLEMLFDVGVNVNEILVKYSEKEMLPIQMAVMLDDFNLLEFFSTANLNLICDDCPATALNMAVSGFKNEAVKFLLLFNAQANICDSLGNGALHAAARVNNDVAVRLILDKYPEIAELPNKFLFTAAEIAFLYGSAKTLEALLICGAAHPAKKIRIKIHDKALAFIYDAASQWIDKILSGGGASRFEDQLPTNPKLLEIIDGFASYDRGIISLVDESKFAEFRGLYDSGKIHTLMKKFNEIFSMGDPYSINVIHAFLLDILLNLDTSDYEKVMKFEAAICGAEMEGFGIKNKFCKVENGSVVSVAYYLMLKNKDRQLFYALERGFLNPHCAFRNDNWDINSLEECDSKSPNLFTMAAVLDGNEDLACGILCAVGIEKSGFDDALIFVNTSERQEKLKKILGSYAGLLERKSAASDDAKKEFLQNELQKVGEAVKKIDAERCDVKIRQVEKVLVGHHVIQ